MKIKIEGLLEKGIVFEDIVNQSLFLRDAHIVELLCFVKVDLDLAWIVVPLGFGYWSFEKGAIRLQMLVK